MTITAYKAFRSDWTCRGYQYEVGKIYEHDGKVSACDSGFHACENPFDCWSYYDLTDAKFARVTQGGDISRHGDDTKIASGKITIEAELTLPEFIKVGVDWIIDKTKGENESSGYYARIGSSGYYAQIGSSGDRARIGSSGDRARIEAKGKNSVVASAGVNARVKGAAGTWVSVAEYVDGRCVGFATGCIGQGGLEPDTWYCAKGGNLVEAA